MNEPTQGEFQPVSAMLQMPQLAPPVDRTAAVPAGADGDTPGVEANFLPLLAGGLGLLSSLL
ncbi:hypothetical protein ACFW9O_34935 [Streptomyces sp. NPDC059499]|uniref:hypothetical protein n=1 Tax=Streptomyces sp. NPDC059499 TaxID=3346852 RepID=UPI0036C81C08